MNPFITIRDLLFQGADLNSDLAATMMEDMVSGTFDDAQMACLLTLWKAKGESVEELGAALRVLRSRVDGISTELPVIDTCGTGGDGAGTFNISTAVALTVAACGVPVAKHGNRKVSSASGSADVLEQLGMQLPASREGALRLLAKTGFTFLFAPAFHPAFANVGKIRKSLVMPTAFNLFGPFLNPCQPKRQIIGVARTDVAERLALAALDLGYEHLILLSGTEGLDEASTAGETVLYEVRGNRLEKSLLRPEDVGLSIATLADIQVSDSEESARVIRNVFKGRQGAALDIVALNAGIALYAAGNEPDIPSGVRRTQEVLLSGAVEKKLEEIVVTSLSL